MLLTSFLYLTILIFTTPYFYDELKNDIPNIKGKEIGLIIFSGLVIVYLGNLLYYYSLNYVDAHTAASIESTAPAFTLLIACMFLNDKINIYSIFGILLIIIGVILVSVNDSNKYTYEYLTERF
jgi:uncharacterized membrane protein